MFLLKKIAASLLLPPLSPLLLIAGGLLLLRHRRRTGLALAWSGTLLLLALSTPFVADRLEASLHRYPPLAVDARPPAQAIVVLAGGIQRAAPEYGGNDTVNARSLVRLRYGAHLHRRTGLPLLLAGGTPQGGRAEAEAMAEVLRTDFGLHARWIENGSRDTGENARHAAALLRAAGIDHILLVTEDFHMRRAMLEFERAGLHPVAAPTGIGGAPAAAPARLPGIAALHRSTLALHEWLGIAAATLRP